MSSLDEQISRLAADGLRPSEIAHRLNVAISTVGYHLHPASEAQRTGRV